MHNCWQQLSTQWFKTKTCFNFLQNGLEAFLWKVKAEILTFSASWSKILHGLLSAQISPRTVDALLTTEGFKPHGQPQPMYIRTHKHRLKTKAYSNIFKTLHCPRQWNTCIRKHVCLQQDQSKVHFIQGETT